LRAVGVEGSTALVTGAAGGIGRSLVKALLHHGAVRIYATDLAPPKPSDIDHDKRYVSLALDITDHEAVSKLAKELPDVTLLFNNAGINLRGRFLASPTLMIARREMETNYFGTLAMCRAFAPILQTNAERGSAIVNILSILAKVTLPNIGTYCATKAALLRMTEGIRAELPDVLVMAVMPWAVDTPISKNFPGSKTSTTEVAERTISALHSGTEEIYLHEFSDEVNRRICEDPKVFERELIARFTQAN
jgi:NAD(P)-dependent dehydrogenase (short-subunit alcohol dehydrogenase family)